VGLKISSSKMGIGLLLVIALALASCTGTQKDAPSMAANSPLKSWIGMSFDELQKVYPDIKPEGSISDRYQRHAKEFGLDGTWTYSFTGNKLKWFIFNAYENTVSKSNFNSYLSATEDMIQNYQLILGTPVRVRSGIHDFNDPTIKPHNGYLVQQVSWNSQLGNVKVDFSFLGENKYYQFLVSVQVSG